MTERSEKNLLHRKYWGAYAAIAVLIAMCINFFIGPPRFSFLGWLGLIPIAVGVAWVARAQRRASTRSQPVGNR